MKSIFIVLSVVLCIGLVSVAPASAEVERVPAVNTAADLAVVIPQTVLEECSVFQPAQVVVEAEDGAFFLLASNDDPADRQAFTQVLYATLKEQLHVGSEITHYARFSTVKVVGATADEVEPILQSFINGYVVGVFFFGGSAYSFAW
ncbi:MAG: hypothetical protein NWE78_03850 [Candidatus Bathyarchaeota archaeon]|nr:hypothetical protein [Candidatus Bathyarchaeota archaeon]